MYKRKQIPNWTVILKTQNSSCKSREWYFDFISKWSSDPLNVDFEIKSKYHWLKLCFLIYNSNLVFSRWPSFSEFFLCYTFERAIFGLAIVILVYVLNLREYRGRNAANRKQMHCSLLYRLLWVIHLPRWQLQATMSHVLTPPNVGDWSSINTKRLQFFPLEVQFSLFGVPRISSQSTSKSHVKIK